MSDIGVNVTDLLGPVGSTYFCGNFSDDPLDLGDQNPVNFFGGNGVGPIPSGAAVDDDGLTYYQYKFYRTA